MITVANGQEIIGKTPDASAHRHGVKTPVQSSRKTGCFPDNRLSVYHCQFSRVCSNDSARTRPQESSFDVALPFMQQA